MIRTPRRHRLDAWLAAIEEAARTLTHLQREVEFHYDANDRIGAYPGDAMRNSDDDTIDALRTDLVDATRALSDAHLHVSGIGRELDADRRYA